MTDNLRLEDDDFIGGGDRVYQYEVNESGVPVVLNGSTITFTLSYIGQKQTPIIVKNTNNGVRITGLNTFTVTLSSEDTKYLESSKYEQEVTIVQMGNRTLRPNYGYIDIRQGSIY